MPKAPPGPCPDAVLSQTLGAMGADHDQGLARIETLLALYPSDPRLLFLRGSLLAGLQRYGEARDAMHMALAQAPDYALARFQLGFLELTSGEADRARDTWRPLHALAPDEPHRLFAEGLEHLIEDRFTEAIERLQRGMARNTEIAPLNHDMQLLIDRMQALAAETPAEPAPAPETGAPAEEEKPAKPAEVSLSPTHLLLQHYGAINPTRH